MPLAALGPVRRIFNGGGLAAFQKFSLSRTNKGDRQTMTCPVVGESPTHFTHLSFTLFRRFASCRHARVTIAQKVRDHRGQGVRGQAGKPLREVGIGYGDRRIMPSLLGSGRCREFIPRRIRPLPSKHYSPVPYSTLTYSHCPLLRKSKQISRRSSRLKGASLWIVLPETGASNFSRRESIDESKPLTSPTPW